VTICREWLLVNHNATEAQSKLLTCKSWNCDYCAPKRRSQLMAQACAGRPNRFLTLTVNPAFGADPEERHQMLTWAWKLIAKRFRRENPNSPLEYFALTEATAAGEPHLHILLRSDFLPKGKISAWMDELIHAPIVDIQEIKNAGQVVRYIAKYVTKKPAQFGSAKRYYHSGHYSLEEPFEPVARTLPESRWDIFRGSLAQLMALAIDNGWAPRRGDADWMHYRNIWGRGPPFGAQL